MAVEAMFAIVTKYRDWPMILAEIRLGIDVALHFPLPGCTTFIYLSPYRVFNLSITSERVIGLCGNRPQNALQRKRQ